MFFAGSTSLVKSFPSSGPHFSVYPTKGMELTSSEETSLYIPPFFSGLGEVSPSPLMRFLHSLARSHQQTTLQLALAESSSLPRGGLGQQAHTAHVPTDKDCPGEPGLRTV